MVENESILTRIELKVLTLRKTMTKKAIAQSYEVTTERIRQIEAKALRKLRATITDSETIEFIKLHDLAGMIY